MSPKILPRFLTSANHRPKDIRIGAVVIAELKLRNVQQQILGADLAERADNAAFENRPEPSIVFVHRADDLG